MKPPTQCNVVCLNGSVLCKMIRNESLGIFISEDQLGL